MDRDSDPEGVETKDGFHQYSDSITLALATIAILGQPPSKRNVDFYEQKKSGAFSTRFFQ